MSDRGSTSGGTALGEGVLKESKDYPIEDCLSRFSEEEKLEEIPLEELDETPSKPRELGGIAIGHKAAVGFGRLSIFNPRYGDGGSAGEGGISVADLDIAAGGGKLTVGERTVKSGIKIGYPPRDTFGERIIKGGIKIGYPPRDTKNLSVSGPKSRVEKDSVHLRSQVPQVEKLFPEDMQSLTIGGNSFKPTGIRRFPCGSKGEVVPRAIGRGSPTDDVSHFSEEELLEKISSEKLEETPSNPRELEDLIGVPREFPPTSSHDDFSIPQELDLSYTEIKSLPQYIFGLVSLKKLFLRSCAILMMELPPEIGELTNLEVLDLEGTEILCLPKEIGKLVNLTCLKVSFYGYANQTVIPRRVLSNLSRLKELIIDVTPYGEWWDVEVKAIIYDLRSLKELTTLKLYLPTPELLKYITLIFPGLANFRFTVGRQEEHFISRLPRDVEEEFNNWEKLEKGLKFINGDCIPNEITKVLKHADAFFLQRHWTVESLSEFGHENLNEVKFFLVMECNEFRTIFDSEKLYQEKVAITEFHKDIGLFRRFSYPIRRDKSEHFPEFVRAKVLGSLEKLIIRYMKNTETIWKGPIGKRSLSNLKSLALHTCPNLTTLFTIDMLRNLKNLEELIVEDCPKINSLASLQNSGSESVLFLPSLKKISLLWLPGLVSISSGLQIAPKLERMVIYSCPKLEKLSTVEVSSTKLKVIKGEKEWWDALKWYESDVSTKLEDYLARHFIPLRRDGGLMAQLTED